MRRLRLTLAPVLLALVLTSAGNAQQMSPGSAATPPRFDVSLGYNYIRANSPPAACTCFSMNGGYASAAYHATNWLSVAGEFTGGHASKISTLGQDLTLTTYLFGPRVQHPMSRFVPFAQILFGGAHGSDSYFPSGGSYTTSASSWAFSAGGGADFSLNRRFSIRAVNVQYLRTAFPNGANNSQNHLMVGAGIVVKFGGRSATRASFPPPTRIQAVPERMEPALVPTPAEATPPVSPEAAFHEGVPDALFDYDSAAIRQDTQVAILHAAEYLTAHTQVYVLIGGYSDERGTSDYNLALGQRRANAARDALIAAGIAADRLEVVSYGKGAQVCTDENEACFQQNRRAAFSMRR